MMDILFFCFLLSAGICLVIAWLGFRYVPNSFGSAYSLLMVCTGYWQLCSALASISKSEDEALQWSGLAYLGAFFIPILLFEVARLAIGLGHVRLFRTVLYALTILTLSLFQYTDYLLNGVNLAHFVFSVLFTISVFLLPIFLLWEANKKVSRFVRPEKVSLARGIAVANLLGFLSVVDFLPNYKIDVCPMSFFSAVLGTFFLTRVCYRHQLLKFP